MDRSFYVGQKVLVRPPYSEKYVEDEIVRLDTPHGGVELKSGMVGRPECVYPLNRVEAA